MEISLGCCMLWVLCASWSITAWDLALRCRGAVSPGDARVWQPPSSSPMLHRRGPPLLLMAALGYHVLTSFSSLSAAVALGEGLAKCQVAVKVGSAWARFCWFGCNSGGSKCVHCRWLGACTSHRGLAARHPLPWYSSLGTNLAKTSGNHPSAL